MEELSWMTADPITSTDRCNGPNRTYPNLWTDLRKVYAEPEKILNSKSGGVSLIKSVPDWCIMPTLFPFLLITNR